ncbi:hypothetical protein EJ07DRAFT_72771, partial [Lizonia empirigonia]
VTAATNAANGHLKEDRPGHGLTKYGPIVHPQPREPCQQSLQLALDSGLTFSQDTYRKLGNFGVEGFTQAAVLWLVNNNSLLREIETKVFREMIRWADPEAEAALWNSAFSKVHISFNEWTTKGGKQGFFTFIAQYADSTGAIVDLPIALPQLVGTRTAEAIANVVAQTTRRFDI